MTGHGPLRHVPPAPGAFDAARRRGAIYLGRYCTSHTQARSSRQAGRQAGRSVTAQQQQQQQHASSPSFSHNTQAPSVLPDPLTQVRADPSG